MQIQATPITGYAFSGWTCTGGSLLSASAAQTSLTISDSCTLTANFTPTPTYALTITASPAGAGTVICTPSQNAYNFGDVLLIQAAPASGYSFNSWSVTGGTVSDSYAASTSLIIAGNCTLMVRFTAASGGGTPVPLDISSGFNIDAITGPAEATAGIAAGQNQRAFMGNSETTNQVSALCDDYGNADYAMFVADTNATTYNGNAVTGSQGLPAGGYLGAGACGSDRPYYLPSTNGVAPSPLLGDWTENVPVVATRNKSNMIQIGQAYNMATWVTRSLQVLLPAGQQTPYVNVNFVLTGGGTGGAGFAAGKGFKIFAVYTDSSTALLYQFTNTVDVGGDGAYFGPQIDAADDTYVVPSDFTKIYTCAEYWNDGSGATGAGYPCTPYTRGLWKLYTFATPLPLNSAKCLMGFIFQDPDTSTNYAPRRLGVFAATAVPPAPVTLTTLVSPPGAGTVTVTPSQAAYSPSTVVTIQAASNTGYSFVSWSVTGGVVTSAGSAVTTLAITNNCTLLAVYEPSSYSGTENVTGGTIILSNRGPFTYGQVITITASAQPGFLFSGWSVTGASSLSNSAAASTSLTVYGNFTLTAGFAVRSPGDINSDGKVDQNDLNLLNARLNGLSLAPYTDADYDVNRDGVVTTADRVRLRKILNGLTAP